MIKAVTPEPPHILQRPANHDELTSLLGYRQAWLWEAPGLWLKDSPAACYDPLPKRET